MGIPFLLSDAMKAFITILLLSLAITTVMTEHRRRLLDSKHRRMGGACHRINGNSCTNIEDDSNCSLFNYPSGNCQSLGYSIECRMYLNMVQWYKQADCAACAEIQRK